MKKILLLGDSIMYGTQGKHGYGFFVKHKLNGKMEVYLPLDNCQDIRYLYTYADELIPDVEGGYDFIHWNNGLWDVLHFMGNPAPYTSPEVYVEYVVKFCSFLRLRYPDAKVFFAQSTAVPENIQKSSSFRRNSEIKEYNALARKALSGKVYAFNDLFSVSSQLGSEYRSDGVHFTEAGSELLAESVYKFLCDQIGSDN